MKMMTKLKTKMECKSYTVFPSSLDHVRKINVRKVIYHHLFQVQLEEERNHQFKSICGRHVLVKKKKS